MTDQILIGSSRQDALIDSTLVQYWLARPVIFMTASLTFLGSVMGYHVKYLSSYCSQYRKSYGSCHPSKVGTSNLILFKYWSSWLCVLQLSLGGTGGSSILGDSHAVSNLANLSWSTCWSLCTSLTVWVRNLGSKLSHYVGKRYHRLGLHRGRKNFTRLSKKIWVTTTGGHALHKPKWRWKKYNSKLDGFLMQESGKISNKCLDDAKPALTVL